MNDEKKCATDRIYDPNYFIEKLKRNKEKEYLIYAAYGSNLLRERFMCYIKGGEFMNNVYKGSNDKTDPEEVGWIWVPYKLYFAKKSSKWCNGGVAFLSIKEEINPQCYSVVRLWKISLQQFVDLMSQEGGWYNKVLCIGNLYGLDVLTITGDYLKEQNPPSQKYIEIIKKGLKETTNWEDNKILAYIFRRIGGQRSRYKPC